MQTKLQIGIIDEHDEGKNISLFLRKEFPEFQILFNTNTFEQAFLFTKKNIPDILFLDVKLTDKSTDFLFELRKKTSQIIFITDSEQFAIKAIKRGIENCLLKPVQNLDFVKTVNITKENHKKEKFTAFRNKINIPTLQGFKRVNIDEIIRCEADSNYTFIYLSDQTKVIVSKTLYDFEKSLSDYNFFRIHNKHLINLGHLKEYIKGKGGQVIMADNSVLNVSVRRKNDFLQKIA